MSCSGPITAIEFGVRWPIRTDLPIGAEVLREIRDLEYHKLQHGNHGVRPERMRLCVLVADSRSLTEVTL